MNAACDYLGYFTYLFAIEIGGDSHPYYRQCTLDAAKFYVNFSTARIITSQYEIQCNNDDAVLHKLIFSVPNCTIYISK